MHPYYLRLGATATWAPILRRKKQQDARHRTVPHTSASLSGWLRPPSPALSV